MNFRSQKRLLKSQSLLERLSDEQIEKILQCVQSYTFDKGEVIFEEGETDGNLFFICSGKVQYYKLDKEKEHEFRLGSLSNPNIFGEMSFLDNAPRPCTVIAKSTTTVLVLSKKDLIENVTKSKTIVNIINENIAKLAAKRLEISNKRYISILKRTEANHRRMQTEFARVFIITVAIMGIAVLMNRLLNTNLQNVNIYSKQFSWTYLLVIVIPFIFLVKSSRFSLAEFGISTRNLKQSLTEGLAISTAGIAVMALSALIYSVVQKTPIASLLVFSVYTPKLLLYLPHTFLQEFMIRGVIQTFLQKFFRDTKGHSSILITSLIFGILHFHFGVAAFFVTFLSSIVFGHIYIRHYNILGVSLVHFILGTFAISLGWL